MKSILLIGFLLLLQQGYSQVYPVLSLRYNEDYSFLKEDSTKNWYEKLKYIPFGKGSDGYISLGGESRYQLQSVENGEWGDAPVKKYTAVYNRFLFHTDVHTGRHFRLFGQLVSTTASGKPTPNRPTDENRLDIQQVFADANLVQRQTQKMVIRLGRQELQYGSQRLLSVRENPNTRLSFDAIKLFYATPRFQADLFYSQPVRNQTGVFDDPVNPAEKLWSVYTVLHQLPGIHNADLYYIGYRNKNRMVNNMQAVENRHSFGTRIWKQKGVFQYDIEALYQFGKWAAYAIDAYTVSFNLRYQLKRWPLRPVIGVKTELISGDKSATDKRVHTFNPLFPRGAYFGLAALIGPANLIDFHPMAEFTLRPGLTFAADYDLFWRYSTADGIYGPSAALLYPAAAGKHIGTQLGLNIEYSPDPHLTIRPEFTFFKAGTYLKSVSAGKDIFFSAFTCQLKF